MPIGIVHLPTVKNILISDGELIIPLDPSEEWSPGYKKPEIKRVVFVNNNEIIGQGHVKNPSTFHDYCNFETRLNFTVEMFKTHRKPIASIQRGALQAHLADRSIALEMLTGILPLPSEFDSLFHAPEWPERMLLGMHSETYLHNERLRIYNDESIDVDETLQLLMALDRCGPIAEAVFGINALPDVDWREELEAYPIIPWELSTNAERLDPHNWIPLPSVFANNFRVGLFSFEDFGEPKISSAVLPGLLPMDCRFEYSVRLLSAQQLSYLKRHREEIFESWLTNPPWLY